MNCRISQDLYLLLRDIIRKREPAMTPLLTSLRETPLTRYQQEELRGLVADELAETGLYADDEPTPRGLKLEHLIDVLGKM